MPQFRDVDVGPEMAPEQLITAISVRTYSQRRQQCLKPFDPTSRTSRSCTDRVDHRSAAGGDCVCSQIHLQSVIAAKPRVWSLPRAGGWSWPSGRPVPTAGDAALKVARTNYLAGIAGTSNLLVGRRCAADGPIPVREGDGSLCRSGLLSCQRGPAHARGRAPRRWSRQSNATSSLAGTHVRCRGVKAAGRRSRDPFSLRAAVGCPPDLGSCVLAVVHRTGVCKLIRSGPAVRGTSSRVQSPTHDGVRTAAEGGSPTPVPRTA
jgi:hypothetical protein